MEPVRGSKNHRTVPSSRSSALSGPGNNSPGPSGLSYFDPTSLVKHKEGSFTPSRSMKRYLGKHLRRCLQKQEWEALNKEHPLPDIDACMAPKADKYLLDYLGKCFPRDQDNKLAKVQTAVLAIARPVMSAWQGLGEWARRGPRDTHPS